MGIFADLQHTKMVLKMQIDEQHRDMSTILQIYSKQKSFRPIMWPTKKEKRKKGWKVFGSFNLFTWVQFVKLCWL